MMNFSDPTDRLGRTLTIGKRVLVTRSHTEPYTGTVYSFINQDHQAEVVIQGDDLRYSTAHPGQIEIVPEED